MRIKTGKNSQTEDKAQMKCTTFDFEFYHHFSRCLSSDDFICELQSASLMKGLINIL